MNAPLSGQPYVLDAGGYRAEVASVGATLRALQHQGRDLVVPFAADEVRPAFRGATLAPWPNRVVDGRYTFDGVAHQLALSEPERGHALHGLVGWLDFTATSVAPDAVVLAVDLPAQVGYPHQVRVEVRFALDAGGLETTVTASNLGASTAPWGTAPHPYLVAGEGRVDGWTLALPADEVLTVSADRLVPEGLVPVDGELDFRTPHPIGTTEIDHAYTGLHRGPDGYATVRVTAPEGPGVEMTWDGACPWVQVHTADRPEPEQDRLGLAVEPMTCAPDAFNSGLGLVSLAPGDQHRASWRIRAV